MNLKSSLSKLVYILGIVSAVVLIFIVFLSIILYSFTRYDFLGSIYREVVPKHVLNTVQIIQTVDDKSVTVNTKQSRYTSTYTVTIAASGYPIWSFKNSNIPVMDQTVPIAFDVVNNIPWIVLPIRGRKCHEYQLPREGLVFFRLEDRSWKQASYDQAPKNLSVNLLQNTYEYEKGVGMDQANCPFGAERAEGGYICRDSADGVKESCSYLIMDESGVSCRDSTGKETTKPLIPNYGRPVTPVIRKYLDANLANKHFATEFINTDGSGKTISEIVSANMELPRIADTSSCYYLNPPVDPNEKRSLREFVRMEVVAVKASLMKIDDEQVEMSDVETRQLLANPRILGSCDKLVKRHYVAQLANENHAEFSQVAGVASGPFKSPGSAERVELNTDFEGRSRSFYLPIRGFSFSRISLMHCQKDRIIVYFGSNTNSQQILEYDLNATLLNKWSVQLPNKETMPLESKNQRMITDITVDKGQMKIKIDDFERPTYKHAKQAKGQITKRYLLEATLP